MIEGSVQKHGDSIRVLTSLINTNNNQQIRSFLFDWEFRNIFEIQNRIAFEIAEELDLEFSPENVAYIKKHPTENLDAYNLYLKGRFFYYRMTTEDLIKSVRYLEQAIKLDSSYASAYAGLADAYAALPYAGVVKNEDSLSNLSKKNAEKALAIDPNCAEAYATLGSISLFGEWNWEAAEKELKLAIRLNPNYANAHEWYADLLNVLGRHEEARIELDKALKLNPFSFMMQMTSSWFYHDVGQFEKCIEEAEKAKDLNKFSHHPYTMIISSYRYLGLDNKAIAEWEKLVKLNPYSKYLHLNAQRREAFKNYGIKGFYRVHCDNLIKNNMEYVNIARILVYLGEHEKALKYLEMAYENRDFDMIVIKKDFALKNLRKEPRFLALLDKMNLGGYDK